MPSPLLRLRKTQLKHIWDALNKLDIKTCCELCDSPALYCLLSDDTLSSRDIFISKLPEKNRLELLSYKDPHLGKTLRIDQLLDTTITNKSNKGNSSASNPPLNRDVFSSKPSTTTLLNVTGPRADLASNSSSTALDEISKLLTKKDLSETHKALIVQKLVALPFEDFILALTIKVGDKVLLQDPIVVTAIEQKNFSSEELLNLFQQKLSNYTLFHLHKDKEGQRLWNKLNSSSLTTEQKIEILKPKQISAQTGLDIQLGSKTLSSNYALSLIQGLNLNWNQLVLMTEPATRLNLIAVLPAKDVVPFTKDADFPIILQIIEAKLSLIRSQPIAAAIKAVKKTSYQIELLLKLQDKDNKTLLHIDLKHSLFLLESLSKDQQKEALSKVTDNPVLKPIGCYFRIINDSTPLDKIDHIFLFNILRTFTSVELAEVCTPVHLMLLIKDSIKKLSFNELIEIFKFDDGTFMKDSSVIERIKELKLSKSQLNTLLTTKNQNKRHISQERNKEVLPLLETLESDDLKALIRDKNYPNYRNKDHNALTFKILKLFEYKIEEIASFPEVFLRTFLHDVNDKELPVGLLDRLTFEDLRYCCLNDSTKPWLIPAIKAKKLDPTQILDLFTDDHYGQSNTFFHLHSDIDEAFDLLETMTPEQLSQILTKGNDQAKTPVDTAKKFTRKFLHVLNKLPINELKSIPRPKEGKFKDFKIEEFDELVLFLTNIGYPDFINEALLKPELFNSENLEKTILFLKRQPLTILDNFFNPGFLSKELVIDETVKQGVVQSLIPRLLELRDSYKKTAGHELTKEEKFPQIGDWICYKPIIWYDNPIKLVKVGAASTINTNDSKGDTPPLITDT